MFMKNFAMLCFAIGILALARMFCVGSVFLDAWAATPDPNIAQATLNARWVEANAGKVEAESTAIIMGAEGEYSVDMARSTQIVADSDQGPINAYQQGKGDGMTEFLRLIAAGIFGIVALYVGYKVFAK